MKTKSIEGRDEIRGNQIGNSGSVRGNKITQLVAFSMILLLAFGTGCKKNDDMTSSTTINGTDAMKMHGFNVHGFTQTNLVSDVAEYNPAHIDTNLVNAWGLAFGATGIPWVNAADKGLSAVYDITGATLRPAVNIPFGSDPNGGNPTGIVFNSTTDFNGSHFIFATENGSIAAWTSGNDAVQMADRSTFGAEYKGLAMAQNAGANYLYATNFKSGGIDVFDASFGHVDMTFLDPGIPADYGPFGIANIDGKLYITYAKRLAPDNEDDEAGPGNGYVSVFNPDGSFVSRFATQGALNSPWGIAKVPAQNNQVETILIGNFGDGHINSFSTTGSSMGQLLHGNQAVEIEGLWALSFAPNATADDFKLYFTAGPDGEEHGVFGVLSRE